MNTTRLEAFSDGVFAIIITIMVLELKTPHGPDLAALRPLAPVFFAYVLSFLFVGIYWNNHHHLLHVAKLVNGRVLWSNQLLLFWLSLVPFATAWIGENPEAPWPVATYGAVLLLCGFAYTVLVRALICLHGTDSTIGRAYCVHRTHKEHFSIVFYFAAILLAFVDVRLSFALFVAVALMWIVPDTRIERLAGGQTGGEGKGEAEA